MADPTTEKFDRRATSRVRAQLEQARTAGAWMPWAGAFLAFTAWAGAAAWLYGSMGLAAILAQPPMLLGGGAALVLTPGFALICAGFMAREGRRSREANAIVLTSAKLLLEPAEHARGEISSIAEAVTRETQTVNKALADTRARMDALKQDIESSVTAALKAAEIVRTDSEVLVSKMSSERQNLTQLAEAIRNQAESLAKAIPRHAQLMTEATRAAQEEVRRAEETMDQRLRGIDDTSKRLAERIGQLDTMGAESRKRAQNLAGALMRLDEQLVQSTRMVDAAMNAGEMATAAAKNTADSLRDAMSDALGSALQAAETINTRSAAASEEARQAMTLLKDAGAQAEATTRAATMAARAQADETEQRISRLSEKIYRTATRAADAAETGADQSRDRIERNNLFTPPAQDDSDVLNLIGGISPAHAASPAPAPEHSRASLLKPTAHADPEGAARETVQPDAVVFPPLFRQPEPRQPEPRAVDMRAPEPRAPEPRFPEPRSPEPRPIEARPVDMRQPAPAPAAPRSPALSWRDLLTGIDEAPAAAPPQADTASTLIDRLDRAGVRLSVVKASDLRRIATASSQGERHRRRAMRDVAPGEIQRVLRLLDTDQDLQSAARDFVVGEEPDALRALAISERARADAPPRLSAYLLLDAALSSAAF